MADYAWPFIPDDPFWMSVYQPSSIVSTPIQEQRMLLTTTPKIELDLRHTLDYRESALAANLVAASNDPDNALWVPVHPWSTYIGDQAPGAYTFSMPNTAWYEIDSHAVVFNGYAGEVVQITAVGTDSYQTTALSAGIQGAWIAPAIRGYPTRFRSDDSFPGVGFVSASFRGDAETNLQEGTFVLIGGYPYFSNQSLAADSTMGVSQYSSLFSASGPEWQSIVRRYAARTRSMTWSFLPSQLAEFRDLFGELMQLRGGTKSFLHASRVISSTAIGITGYDTTIQACGMHLDPPTAISFMKLDGTVATYTVNYVTDGGALETITTYSPPTVTVPEVEGVGRVDVVRLAGPVQVRQTDRDLQIRLEVTRCPTNP